MICHLELRICMHVVAGFVPKAKNSTMVCLGMPSLLLWSNPNRLSHRHAHQIITALCVSRDVHEGTCQIKEMMRSKFVGFVASRG